MTIEGGYDLGVDVGRNLYFVTVIFIYIERDPGTHTDYIVTRVNGIIPAYNSCGTRIGISI